MTDSVFYGETEARDCLVENECLKVNSPACRERSAIQIAYFAKAGKDPLPKSEVKIPIHKIKADASYGGKITYRNLKFYNYKSNKTFCGTQQVLFRLNRFAADYIPRAKVLSSSFENIH